VKKIKMVTRLGDQEVVVGECSSAQARILSKKEHGKFVDGKLMFSNRPIHADMAVNSIASEDKDPNVSTAEVRRRLDWFRGLLGPGTLAALPRGSDLSHILSVHKGLADVKHLWKLSPEEMKGMSPEVLRFHRVRFIGGGVNNDPHFKTKPITERWVKSLFTDTAKSKKMGDPGPCKTYGHREADDEEYLEPDGSDYRDHIRICKASFNLTGAPVNRGVHEFEEAA
jgi:hypothetical protein